MTSTLTQRPARRPLGLAVMGALTLVLAVVVAGALAWHDGGPATTVTRPPDPVEGVAPTGASAAPLVLPSSTVVVPPAETLPRRPYEDWQINEMTARHPEP